MMKDLIEIGDKLELKKIRVNSKEMEHEKIYKSQVLDFKEDETAVILMPMDKGRIIPLSIGDKYGLRFFTKKGLYQCRGVITNRLQVNNIFILTVQCISDLEKFQRRQFYRLECILDIEYYVVSDMEVSITTKLKDSNYKDEVGKQQLIKALEVCKREWETGTILDISGGGARFVSNRSYDYGDIIKLQINFSNEIELKNCVLDAVIITSEKMIHRQGFYENRIQFKELQKNEREAIIKYIFEEERRRRSKEKK
ncbi:flagellar protein [Anaerocolumna cellulosilytica]|uniref:Flagellar protein n=1 Tax=Anaerocolumna cellulosilytica TaxID=433286 RepID=A0A6S6R7I6_9FIRM|nr:flagellar brake protein [Anaerocolumna cellulosilytica]MBB5197011.1 c-di-GMP-binding flagellar brake protein YcgR [Anaerocolumna cellulosilytica]BCJ95225.1 flagellar protein [Anaerocolumna cellulosilytica]